MKKLLLIVAPLLAVGAVVALAMLGIINIPGLTPHKDWKATLLKIYGQKGSLKGDLIALKDATKEETAAFLTAAKEGGLEGKEDKAGIKSAKLAEWLQKNVTTAPAEKPKPKKQKTTPATSSPAVKPKPAEHSDPEKGIETIAEIWSGLDAKHLNDIVKTYKDPDIARILLKMDTERVTAYLEQLPSEKAAKLSKELQKQASVLAETKP